MSSPAALLAAALEYAAAGWRVVPLHEVLDSRDGPSCSCGKKGCESQGKHPRPKAWQKVATTDPAVVRGWWAERPAGNVGIALGSASNVVSVDVDTAEGEAILRQLAGGDPAPTLEYRTGKGRRLLYEIPDTLDEDPKTTVRKGPDGSEAVRFQGTGGQCVMPPSLHPSGRRYEWVGAGMAGAIAPMPGWLVAEMSRPAAEPRWSDQGARDAFAEGPDFNRDADWFADVLGPAGFTEDSTAGDVKRYTRPGKTGGVSVTVGYYRATDGTPALYVFSGSIPELEAGHCYDKFGAYARLHHRKDFAAAAAALRARGYGTRRPAGGSGGEKPKAGGGDWGDPIPLDDPSPGLPAFPLHVLPRGLADLCESAAESVGCPADYPAATALAVAAAAVGASYDLQVKRGFSAPSNLWVCVVAPPGSGKSPAVAPVVRPVFERQAERRRRKEPGKPVYVSDVTVEKLAQFLEDNPRGLLMYWDEMAGWLTSFNQYKAGGKGNDRAHYLSIWDGRSLKVDRKGPDSPPVFAARPRLSVAGGIQPEVLDELRAGPADGLFDRLLFSYPADPGLAVETFAEVDEAASEAWAAALGQLWAADGKKVDEDDANPDAERRPREIPLLDDGRPVWQDWTRELATRALAADAAPYFRAVAAKIQGYTARLALVVHRLHEAYSPGASGRGVGAAGMARGVELAEYFLAHAARVRRAAGRDARLVRARALWNWIVAAKKVRLTTSDAWASLRRNAAFARSEDLDEPFRILCVHRCLRPESEDRAGPGRPARGGWYAVNPKVVSEADRTV